MKDRGYTLLELVLVIVIMAILTGIAVQSLTKTSEGQRLDRTMEEMDLLVRAIVGDDRLVTGGVRTDFGYVGDIGSLPPTLDALVANPGGYATWSGPYISNRFMEDVDDYKTDAWKDPYVYSGGVTITSNGGGNPITRRIAGSVSELTSNSIYGVVQDGSGCPPSDSAAGVLVTIVFPDGAGSITSLSTSPAPSGEFSFENAIPIGVHLIRAVASGVNDTTSNLWTGSSSGQINYVLNSAYTSPAGNMVGFQIINTNSVPVIVAAMTLEYSSSPQAYYKRIQWNGVPVWNQPNPRIGSGDPAGLAPPQTMASMAMATIEIDTWMICRTGSCADYDIHGTTFTVEFSNGDIISFTAP
jgi:prepilin-type N-terminal cleavage/methylation domain-containing protein